MAQGKIPKKYKKFDKRRFRGNRNRSNLSRMVPKPRQKEELKYHDVAINDTTGLSITGDVHLLNGIAQGTAVNQRVGNRIIIKSIYLKCYVTVHPTTPLLQSWRFGQVIDKKAMGLLPTISGGTTNSIFDQTRTYALMNKDNMGRFVTLGDRKGIVDATTDQRHLFRYYKKLNLEVIYKGSGGAYTDIMSNGLWAYHMGDGASSIPPIVGTYRISYVDA